MSSAHILEKVLVFDGGMGTMLLEKGLKPGDCPELLNIEKPEQLEEIHLAYLKAGADVISTNSFGGNRLKLTEYGLQNKVKEINVAAVKVAKKVANRLNRYVAASVGPTGQFIEPLGTLTFEEIYEIFKEQIGALAEAEPDFILLETFHDLGEIRAALLAARDVCSIPVICTLTFEGRRTLTGVSPASAAVVLESLGAAAIGANCSGGPDALFSVVEEIVHSTNLPVIVQPNAGLPQLIEGKASYSLEPEAFIQALEPYFHIGVNIFGSCCGSTPSYTAAIRKRVEGFTSYKRTVQEESVLASKEKVVYMGNNQMPLIVGERINPTARKRLAEGLRKKEFSIIQNEADIQVEAGAHMLDINIGTHGIDEVETMYNLINLLQQRIKVPLMIDSTNKDVINKALQIYNGKALVNSVNGEEKNLQEILPIIKYYGASIVGLTLDEKGIPSTAEERYKVAEKIVNACEEYGIPRRDIYIDCLALTIGTDDKASIETLKTMKMVKEKLGVNTILGVSNVSHGLPNRSKINAAFLAMTIVNGLDLAIINPLDRQMVDIWEAASLLAGRDQKAKNYIKNNSVQKDEAMKNPAKSLEKPIGKPSFEAIQKQIIAGSENVVEAVESSIEQGIKPLEIINEGLVPGLEIVGEKFNSGEFFLPQLILSAEVAEKAFQCLEKYVTSNDEMRKKGTIIIGTVKGDIHDIGKNIVAVILKNHGYHVVDLGKDVEAEDFLEAAKREKAEFVGLSALMTTTMMEIPRTIKYIRNVLPDIKIIVGGAVVTEEYAKESGADGYSQDAVTAVKILEKLKVRS